MTKTKTLSDLFHDTLKDIYFAEKKIMSALPKMAKAAQSDELRQAFEKHLEETEGQVERLDAVFEEINQTPRGKTCDAIMGILDEGKEIMSEYKGTPALDAGRRDSKTLDNTECPGRSTTKRPGAFAGEARSGHDPLHYTPIHP